MEKIENQQENNDDWGDWGDMPGWDEGFGFPPENLEQDKEPMPEPAQKKPEVQQIDRQLVLVAEIVQASSKDPDAYQKFIDTFTELKEQPDDLISAPNAYSKYRKSDVFRSYCRGHGLSDQVIQGFKENVIPLIDSGDKEVEPLLVANNSWGTTTGDFGISDFVVHALVSEVNPRNTRDLMVADRLVPTGDYAKFEQNRRDASALQGTLWRGRDFIHDERPGIHELLSAMVQMYDAKDNPEEYEKKRARLEELAENRLDPNNKYFYAGFDGKMCFDLDGYDKMITKTTRVGNDSQGAVEYSEPAIDILRRLVKNTEASLLEKPVTDDEELNALLQKMDPRITERSGEVFVDFKQAAKLITKMNEILKNSQGRIGMKPSMVHALSYAERMATYAMRGVDAKDYEELPFDPGFKEMVRFAELTSSSTPYSESEFESFWNGFERDCSKSFEEGVDYTKLVLRVIGNASGLAKQYNNEGRPAYMIESIWSGNLVHELIGLTDKR
jgi:hypothetical protein